MLCSVELCLPHFLSGCSVSIGEHYKREAEKTYASCEQEYLRPGLEMAARVYSQAGRDNADRAAPYEAGLCYGSCFGRFLLCTEVQPLFSFFGITNPKNKKMPMSDNIHQITLNTPTEYECPNMGKG